MPDYKETYRSMQESRQIQKTRELLDELPGYVSSYVNSKFEHLESRTRLSYVQDIRIFFLFLIQKNPMIHSFQDISLDVLDHISFDDLSEYTAWLEEYQINGITHKNKQKGSGKKRKLSALSSLYDYLVRSEKVSRNPVKLIDRPKKESKEIRILEPNEQGGFLNVVEHGSDQMSEQMQRASKKNELRDKAIIYTLLGTGLRVSELVGLNVSDVNFDLHRLNVYRKGGSQQYVYTNAEIEDAICDYLDNERPQYLEEGVDQPALFLSRKKTRMSVRAVERMVKKYADLSLGTGNGITPHKMRSTFATRLYSETGDIYMVSKALNHKSVDLTASTYAREDKEALKEAIKRDKF